VSGPFLFFFFFLRGGFGGGVGVVFWGVGVIQRPSSAFSTLVPSRCCAEPGEESFVSPQIISCGIPQWGAQAARVGRAEEPGEPCHRNRSAVARGKLVTAASSASERLPATLSLIDLRSTAGQNVKLKSTRLGVASCSAASWPGAASSKHIKSSELTTEADLEPQSFARTTSLVAAGRPPGPRSEPRRSIFSMTTLADFGMIGLDYLVNASLSW